MKPIFIDYVPERLFCVFREPDPSTVIKGSVIVLPAFAEEMNRTRSFASAVATQLADNGFYVLQPDLSGTGDSTGEFKTSTWEKWIGELEYLSQWLAKKCHPLNIVTIRAGALFLPGLLKLPSVTVENICMVEPFISGEEYMSLFLQQRVARSMFEGPKESIALLTGELKSGATLVVGGYELSPGMYESLCLNTIESVGTILPQRNLVIGCGNSEANKRNANFKALVESWNEHGAAADYIFVETDPFWSQELPTIPGDAVTKIVKFLAESP